VRYALTLGWYLLAGAVGLAVGVTSVGMHRVLVAGLPLGLALGAVSTLAVAWALRLTQRSLVVPYVLGWLAAVGFSVVGRPEGDVAVAGDLLGYVLMGVALLMLVIGVTSLAARDSSQGRGGT
jgi:hypothetical protein